MKKKKRTRDGQLAQRERERERERGGGGGACACICESVRTYGRIDVFAWRDTGAHARAGMRMYEEIENATLKAGRTKIYCCQLLTPCYVRDLFIFYFYTLFLSSYCFCNYLEIISKTLFTVLILFFCKLQSVPKSLSTVLVPIPKYLSYLHSQTPQKEKGR